MSNGYAQTEPGDFILIKAGRDQLSPDRTRGHDIDPDATLDQIEADVLDSAPGVLFGCMTSPSMSMHLEPVFAADTTSLFSKRTVVG